MTLTPIQFKFQTRNIIANSLFDGVNLPVSYIKGIPFSSFRAYSYLSFYQSLRQFSLLTIYMQYFPRRPDSFIIKSGLNVRVRVFNLGILKT